MPYPYSCLTEYKGGMNLTNTVNNTRLLPYRKKSLFDKIRFGFSVCLFLFFFLVPVNAYASLGGYECFDLYQEITSEAEITNGIMKEALKFAGESPFEIIEKITTNKTFVDNLKTATMALSLTIATLLLSVDFFKKSVNFEWSRSWENILLFLVKVIVIKVMVQNSDNIIESVYQGFDYINDQIRGAKDFDFIPVGTIHEVTITKAMYTGSELLNWATSTFDLGDEYLYTISPDSVHFLHPEFYVPIGDGEPIQMDKYLSEVALYSQEKPTYPIITLIFDQIYFLAMKAMAALVFVQVIGRAFELTVYTLLAPLPLATFASEVNCDVAKNFLKKYIACILQLTVIIIMFLAYQGLVATVSGSALMGLVSFITLGIGVMKSGQWARNICGTN